MIRGTVNARREAVVLLRIRRPGGPAAGLNAVVDTGFTGQLTLPGAFVATLGLNRKSVTRGVMADGSRQRIVLYAAELEWDGVWRPIEVSALGGDVLIGIQLLSGYEFRMAVVPGGPVEITPLP